MLMVSVANTDGRMLDRLKELWGGNYYFNQDTRKGKPYWQWQLKGVRAGSFLGQVFPYLIVKHEQAALAIEFATLIPPAGNKTAEPGRLRKEEIVDELKKLKRRSHPPFSLLPKEKIL